MHLLGSFPYVYDEFLPSKHGQVACSFAKDSASSTPRRWTIWNDDIWMWFMENHWMMIVGKIGTLENLDEIIHPTSWFFQFSYEIWMRFGKKRKKTSIFSKRPTECRAKVHGLTGLTMSPGGSICRPLPAGDWEDEGCAHTLGRAEAGWWRFLPWLACG
jgi:hypothetical protein